MRIKITIVLLTCSLYMWGAVRQPMEIVREYATNLSAWCESKDVIHYSDAIRDLCTRNFRISDKIICEWWQKKDIILNHYDFEDYEACLNDLISKGINIHINNIRIISRNEYNFSVSSEGSIDKQKNLSKKHETIVCDIMINGALNKHVQDLFYVNIREGKIAKITPYEEEIDKRTGKKKVKVDFSDLLYDEQTLGMTYNYGKSWPIGFSINYSYSWFMISADMGFCSSKDKLYKHDLEMTDVMNFKKTDETYTPKFFFTITPSFYMKYFAVGCGTGLLYMKGTQDVVRSFFIEEANAGSHSTTIESSTHDQEKKEKIKFMLRPSLKGFIPISENTFISLAVGYNYAFGYKDKNEVFFGAGIQFNLN